MSLNTIKHLLPRGKAWILTPSKKLRKFFDGLSSIQTDVKQFVDLVWLDIFPATTRELDQWLEQWGVGLTGLSTAQKRDQLAAAWKMLGGQSPRYIQDVLQDAGFNVYVHEWYDPATVPMPGVKLCVTPRNPLAYIRPEYTGGPSYTVVCGNSEAICGEPTAICGETTTGLGYPLVNKILVSRPEFTAVCGNNEAICGEPETVCGAREQANSFINYTVPNDADKWPFFLYIGGETFPDLASVPVARQDELEKLCLKICPSQQWLGMLIQYV